MDKRKFISYISLVLLVFLTIMLFIQNEKIHDLDQRLNYYNNQLSQQFQNIDSSIYAISDSVSRQLNEFTEQAKWILEKDLIVNKVDLENEKINVTINWAFRELEIDDEIQFLYREKSSNEWLSLKIEHQGGLNYSANVDLNLEGNYETQIIAISPNSKKSESIFPLYFGEQLDSRIQIHGDFHIEHNSNTKASIHTNVYIQNAMENTIFPASIMKQLKIKDAVAKYYVDGELIKEFDLLDTADRHDSGDYYEYIDFYNHFLVDNIDESSGLKELIVIVEDYLGNKYESKINGFSM